MRRLSPILILLLLGAARSEARSKSLCELYADIYKKSIQKRILSGVPFELMSALFSTGQNDGQLVFKKAIHITYNLWDEVVVIRSGEQVLGKVSIEEGQNEICKHLTLHPSRDVEARKKYRYRLLLNPMWNQRMARLQISTTSDLESRRLVDVNWKKLADEMPSEKILLEEEFEL